MTPPSKVSRVTWRGKGGYVVRWREGTRNRSKSSKDKAELETLRLELLEQERVASIDAGPPQVVESELPDPGALRTIAEWATALEACARAAHRAVISADTQAMRLISAYSRQLTELHKQWIASRQYAELEHEFGKLLDFFDRLCTGTAVMDAHGLTLVSTARKTATAMGVEPVSASPATTQEPRGPQPTAHGGLAATLARRTRPGTPLH